MTIALIVAVSDNGVIGKDNDLPWYLPDDLKHFRNTTRGCPVIMGRKNFESIEQRLKGPLPGRLNIVVTRQEEWGYEGVEVVGSLESAIALAQEYSVERLHVASQEDTHRRAQGDIEKEVFIIGGGQIYKQALENDLVEKMYITYVHAEIDGDVFFPELNLDKWKEIEKVEHAVDDDHVYPFTIVTFERR